MKRSLFILLAGVIGIVVIFLFRPKPPAVNEQVATPQPIQTNSTSALEVTNTPTVIMTQILQTSVVPQKSKEPFDVLKAQSIADWTNAIPNIKQWSHFRTRSSWVADQRDTNIYPILLLTGVGGKTVQFTAKLTSVDAMGDHIQMIEIHTPNMSIDQTREFGHTLLQIMGKDKTGFDAWCDKVGNKWVDAPEFTSGGSQMPGSNKFYGFGTHITFNNEKPWYILFFITDP